MQLIQKKQTAFKLKCFANVFAIENKTTQSVAYLIFLFTFVNVNSH